MLDETRIGLIERAIAQYDAEGRPWSNVLVYERVGGNYGELAQYLKARRAQTRQPGRGGGVAEAVAEEAMAQEAPASLQEQLTVAQVAQSHAAGRLAHLRSQADSLLLSEDEETEMLRLEARLARMEPVLARLYTELLAQQETTDVGAFLASWEPLRAAKVEAYDLVAEAVRRLWWAVGGLHTLHGRQEQAIDTLPPRLARKLHQDFLPDPMTVRQRLAGVLEPSRGWVVVLMAEPTVPTAAELMANDPGVREVPPTLLPHILEGRL